MAALVVFSLAALLADPHWIDSSTLAFLAILIAVTAAVVLVQDEALAEGRANRRREREAERALRIARCPATGALTRQAFLDACEKRFDGISPKRPLAYFAIDMDHLKTINDSLGHEVGDAALRRLVDYMRAAAGKDALIGRLGGDEFAFLTPCASSEEAMALAARLRQKMEGATIVQSRELKITATIGIVLLPEQTRFLTETMQFADLALYAGKNGGRDRARLFTPAMLLAFRKDQQVERALRLALEHDGLTQTYLPITNADGRMVVARATLEWTHEWMGVVPPETFLRVAEATKLIDRLGEWSIRRACQDAMRLEADIPVSVQVSFQQLRRDDIVEIFRKALSETGLAPSRVIAVIGHRSVVAFDKGVHRRVRALNAIGIEIALDDIGAVAALCADDRYQDFPAHSGRIAAHHIARLGQSERDNQMVTALTSLGRALGLRIVATGITSRDQVLLARTAGCCHFTGPYLGEATDVAGINARLSDDLCEAAPSPERAIA